MDKAPQNYGARSNLMWTAIWALNTLVAKGKSTDWMVHMLGQAVGVHTDATHGMTLSAVSLPYYCYILKKFFILLMVFVLVMSFTACENETQSNSSEPISVARKDTEEAEDMTVMKMSVTIGEQSFTVTLENNSATHEFVKMMEKERVSIDMDDYSGFEKVGSLGKSLPTDNRKMTTQAGDIVLYSGNQIVMFYGSNSWDYTKIGRIDDLSGWEDALGTGNVTAVFSIAK